MCYPGLVLLCMRACIYPCFDLFSFVIRSLSFLVSWSVICCQDGFLTAFAKGTLPEEYLSHNFDEQCLGGHWAYLMPFLP